MSFRFPFGYNLRQFSVAFDGAAPRGSAFTRRALK
jgi:hypothetical protein